MKGRRKPVLGVRSILGLVSMGTLLAYFLMNLCLSGLFMNQFYLSKVKKQLMSAYQTVLQHPDGDLEAMAELERGNLRILLVNPDNWRVVYNSRMDDRLIGPMLAHMLPTLEGLLEEAGEDYVISTMGDEELTTAGVRVNVGEMIFLGGRVGELVVEISTNREAIDNAVDIAVQFSLVTGMLLMAVTWVLYNRLARQIIRPLEEMADVAGQIAKLDFTKRCQEGPENELGHLSRSINAMSDTMQQYIAELEEANRQLRADIRQKEKDEQARRSLVDNISHDLKTPIALISGYAEGLGSGMAKTPETVKEYCDVICDESDRMLELITRMLALSRVESGTLEPETEEFSLSDLLDDLVGMFAYKAETDGIRVEKDYPEDCYVLCDYVGAEQALTNYIQNALTHLTGEKRVRVSLARQDGLVQVRVFNTAEPICDEDRERMWDTFYRGEKSRHRRGGECGLGLAIVRSNMELMGLPYGMENVTGGVVFWLSLPLAPNPEETE